MRKFKDKKRGHIVTAEQDERSLRWTVHDKHGKRHISHGVFMAVYEEIKEIVEEIVEEAEEVLEEIFGGDDVHLQVPSQVLVKVV